MSIKEKIYYECFDTQYEEEDFANSSEQRDYYGIKDILSIALCDKLYCWVVYFLSAVGVKFLKSLNLAKIVNILKLFHQ